MKKILYFVRGVPSHAEFLEAQSNYALIRDCTAWHEGDCLEVCDSVMGKAENIPEPYKQKWQGDKQPENPVAEPEVAPSVGRGRKSSRQEIQNQV